MANNAIYTGRNFPNRHVFGLVKTHMTAPESIYEVSSLLLNINTTPFHFILTFLLKFWKFSNRFVFDSTHQNLKHKE